MYERDGPDGLTAKPQKGGRPRNLSAEHYPELAAFLSEGPLAHGFDTDQ